jgi:hypothetical protein
MADVLRRNYILPVLHNGETRYPVELEGKPPIPLTDSVHTGSWDNFRHMVWRSVVAYEPQGLSYDVVSLARLADVIFSREADLNEGYGSMQELAEPHLIVLTIPPTLGVTKWTGVTIGTLLDNRQHKGRPTWIYTGLNPNQLFTDLLAPAGPRVADALKPLFTTAAMQRW